MGLLERIKGLLRSNVNDVLQKAEDPERALDQLIRTMQEDLAQARAGVAATVRDERKLRDEYQYRKQQAATMMERAELATAQGNDDLAREALRRRRQHLDLVESIKERWEIESQTLAELRGNLTALEAKIEETRRKKEALLARRRLARVRREMQDTSGLSRHSRTQQTFERLTDRIDDLEAEAEAFAEVAVRDVTLQIESLGNGIAASEQDLEAELEGIKRRLKKS